MCTIFLAWQQRPERALLLLGNRDEFHHRPSAAAKRNGAVFGGQDLREGGMWMGLNALNGRFAGITNIRDKSMAKGQLSRGKLVHDFLHKDIRIDAFNCILDSNKQKYGGFNLFFGTPEEAWHFNSQNGHSAQPLAPGIYGLSNADLDSPWPKVVSGKKQFGQLIEQQAEQEALIAMMQNQQQAPKNELPRTGVSPFLEKMLSALFIRSPIYGTRSTTLIEFNQQEWRFAEQTFGRKGTKKQPLNTYNGRLGEFNPS